MRLRLALLILVLALSGCSLGSDDPALLACDEDIPVSDVNEQVTTRSQLELRVLDLRETPSARSLSLQVELALFNLSDHNMNLSPANFWMEGEDNYPAQTSTEASRQAKDSFTLEPGEIRKIRLTFVVPLPPGKLLLCYGTGDPSMCASVKAMIRISGFDDLQEAE